MKAIICLNGKSLKYRTKLKTHNSFVAFRIINKA